MRMRAFRLDRRLVWAWLGLMATLHAWLASSVSDELSLIVDEIAHITAGYTYWQEHDYRLQPENGVLPQRWATLPLLLTRPQPASPDDPAWAQGDVWQLGDRFFHARGNDPAALLRASRTMIALLGGALVFVLGLWAWQLAGRGAAFVTSVLAAFSPTLLAHAGLATSDTAGTLGFIVALGAWWKLLHRVTTGRVVAAGVAAGVLALSKFSAVLFPPLALALLAVRLARPTSLRVGRRRFTGVGRAWMLGGAGIGAAVVALTLLWAGYGFRYRAAGEAAPAGARFFHTWDEVLLNPSREAGMLMADGTREDPTLMEPGIVQRFVRWVRERRALPEAWLHGLAYVDVSARYRPAFFAGEWKATGWWNFFPVAYLMKSTWSELTLHALGLAALIGAARDRRGRALLYRAAPLLAFIAVYGGFSLCSSLNIGHRHILPLYGAAAVLAALAWSRHPGRLARLSIALALVVHLGTSLSARPDYLAYFNALAGGTRGAHHYFADSSLDWGQDLPRLARWLEGVPGKEPVYLSYFGTADPQHAGLRVYRIGDTFSDARPRQLLRRWHGGWFVISATMWQRVYTQVRGPWTSGYEQRYQELRRWFDAGPEAAAELDAAEVQTRLAQYEHLRFGRLCHYLHDRVPDERIGATLLAFRLSEAEVEQALEAPLTFVAP